MLARLDNGPEALGGVIGGEASGCTEATNDVFVESAFFDPVRTAMTGRVMPSATRTERSRTSSARIGALAKLTVRVSVSTTVPSAARISARSVLLRGSIPMPRHRLTAIVRASFWRSPSNATGSTASPFRLSRTVWPGRCMIATRSTRLRGL
ncbi:phenylalanine--tRNA ligase beta subunit-related protein [uncultured Parasphingopyxis sp.]|uniref:phenylalanine--tRNA ligase beta subunit-related protein n=1 Tax=uncultured Parasphingopyxis sp. TaxID=1547918 RepID=UPI00345BCA73